MIIYISLYIYYHYIYIYIYDYIHIYNHVYNHFGVIQTIEFFVMENIYIYMCVRV